MKKATDMNLEYLEGKHHQLDTAVELMLKRTHLTPNEHDQVTLLKKRKLMLKDGIEALRQEPGR